MAHNINFIPILYIINQEPHHDRVLIHSSRRLDSRIHRLSNFVFLRRSIITISTLLVSIGSESDKYPPRKI